MKDTLKEAIAICETALSNVNRQRIFYLVISLLLVVPLLWTMGLDYLITNISYSIGFNFFRLLLTALLCYVLFMSSIWNSLETNALKAGCLAMEIHLLKLGSTFQNNFNK